MRDMAGERYGERERDILSDRERERERERGREGEREREERGREGDDGAKWMRGRVTGCKEGGYVTVPDLQRHVRDSDRSCTCPTRPARGESVHTFDR